MIDRLSLIESQTSVPYPNIALEEFLLFHTGQQECILYLWQNKRTVVIGKNQNSWKECYTEQLEADGGYLARRLSGGGAVFHDLGNLNFTFLAHADNFDVSKQTDVILQAVKKLGIQAEKNGRNDITVDGKKFSGNAYYRSGDCCYHHGTLLLDVDKTNMGKYLNVSKEKLQSKGVDSVKSRVTNLIEYAPEITVDLMKQKLKEAFSEVYGLIAIPYEADRLCKPELEILEEKFSSWEWKYGRKLLFTNESHRHFSWGEVQVQLKVEQGKIREAAIWSDGLEPDIIGAMAQELTDTRYCREDLISSIQKVSADTTLQCTMKEDITSLLCSMI